MTNNEALIIAANFDVIIEMQGMDMDYSLELLEESKKAQPVQQECEKIKDLLGKKIKPLQAKLSEVEGNEGKTKAIEADIKKEESSAQKAWEKIIDEEFKGTFGQVDLSRIPKENIDKRVNKDGISIVRTALMFLGKKGLLKK